MKQIVFSKDALKSLGRMPAQTSMLIRSEITQYVSDPTAQANNVRPLKGMQGVLRLRVGDWRVLFTDAGEVVAVIKVATRGGAYQ